jgi:uncharacterized membrane protein YfcA
VDFDIVAILTGVAFVAGFVDAIAGGGGLLVLPSLLLAGLDPVAALATNKLQGSFGTGSSVIAYARQRHIDFRSSLPMLLMTFAGAVLGVLAVKYAPTSLLAALMPLLLIVMAAYFALTRKLSNEDATPRITKRRFSLTVAPGVGFYDGIFGPGAGSFYLLGFVTMLGYGVVRASAHTRLLNFTSNFAALLTFAVSGKIVWLVGLPMAAGQILGAQIGTRLAISHGARIIRPLLVIVCVGMAIRLLLDPANPWRELFP